MSVGVDGHCHNYDFNALKPWEIAYKFPLFQISQGTSQTSLKMPCLVLVLTNDDPSLNIGSVHVSLRMLLHKLRYIHEKYIDVNRKGRGKPLFERWSQYHQVPSQGDRGEAPFPLENFSSPEKINYCMDDTKKLNLKTMGAI